MFRNSLSGLYTAVWVLCIFGVGVGAFYGILINFAKNILDILDCSHHRQKIDNI